MLFADALTLDAPRRTTDGYMAVRAKAARTGVYAYTGREIDPQNAHGLRDKASVNVLRDENTVFDTKAARSFIGKPVTDDHPSTPVNSTNWRDHSRGVVMGALRDGDYLAFDIMVTDQALIDKIDAGKRDLSNGYAAELEFGDFKAADGTVCQVRQSRIVGGNHVAVVKDGRAGKDCAIADAATCDSAPQSFLDSLTNQEKPVKNFVLDGLTVDLANADTAIATVQALRDQRDTLKTDLATAQTAIATKDRELAERDTKITDLTAKVADEATLDARADAKAEIVARGKALLGDKMPDVKGKSLADTRRAIVTAHVGDATLADKSDEYIEARFDGLKDSQSVRAPSGMPLAAIDTKTVRDLASASRY